MAYRSTPITTFSRSTPRDGILLGNEYSQLYQDIETYICGNSGSAPPYTLKQLADGTVSFTGAKTFSGSLTASGSLILPAATTPAQTAEGSIVWDSDNDLLTVGDGTSRKTMVDTSQDQTIAGTKTFSSTIVGNIDGGVKETGSGGGIVHNRIVDIGDWNMDSSTTATVNITGLNISKIRGFRAIIRDDTANLLRDLASFGAGTSDQICHGHISMEYVASTLYIYLSRATGGLFDSSSYDSTSYNRGWVIVEYID